MEDIEQFIRRVAFGQTELSMEKVFAEYVYFKKRARELYDEYFHEDLTIGDFNDQF